MARKNNNDTPRLGRLRAAANAVKRLFGKGTDESQTSTTMSAAPATSPQAAKTAEPRQPRTTRRETDIPLDVLGRTYTPPFTGGKAGFRSDGADHQSDQEFAYGVSDERWNDEDRLTNKSGDPRIGTHRRTYEPGEAQSESRE
jgi:hypothetical protein